MKYLKILLSLSLLFLCCKTHNMSKVIYNNDTSNYTHIKLDTVLKSNDKYSNQDDHVKSINIDDIKNDYVDKINLKTVKSNVPITTDTNISIGQVIYQVPDTMVIFKEYRIVVRITRDKNISNTLVDISSKNGSVSTSKIQVSNQMEVTLKDESQDDDTEWIFNVTPIKNGEKRLDLVISIIKNDHKKQIVYSDTIIVKNNEVLKVKSFWEKYWQWIISTIFIPFIIWLYKKITDKKD